MDFQIQITMAAIDPTAEPANKDEPKRATLKIVRQAMDGYSMGDSDSEDEDEDEDESSDEEEKPKDKKSAKASKKNEKMDVDSEDEDEDEDDEEEGSIERFVLCTLDSEKVNKIDCPCKVFDS
jgi:FK506-binding nuclear protein